MKITKSDYEKLNSKLSKLETFLNGGKGSGNFGHEGRPGKRGGSGRGIDAGTVHSSPEVGREGEDSSQEEPYIETEADKHTSVSGYNVSEEIKDAIVDYTHSDEFRKKRDKIYELQIMEDEAWKDKQRADEQYATKKKYARIYEDGPQGHLYSKELYGLKEDVWGASDTASSARKMRKKLEKEIEQSVKDIIKESGEKKGDYKVMPLIGTYYPTEEVERTGVPGNFVIHIEKKNGVEKKMAKLSKEDYEELKNKLENLEKLLNGGKGSGNFGHSGRPGKRGGSGGGKGGKYAVGDTFEKDGETFTVEEDGRGGKEGVSADRKVVTTTPDDYAKMRGGMQSDRLSQVGAPKSATEEVDRLYKKIEDGDAEGADNYLETAVGALSGWAEGNGGTAKPQSDAVKEKINDVITDMVLDTIDVDYKARGQKMDDIVSKIGDKIYETGDEYICPKKEMIDGIKGSIKILHDDYPDINDFKEQASGTIEDLRDVMKMSPKSYVSVSEHPMSASGLVYRELSKEDADTISEQRRKEKDAAAAFWR